MAPRPRYTQAPLRQILVLLSQAEGGTATFSELIERLRGTFTPNESDLGPPRYPNSEAAWIDYLIDNRTAFVRVGWVTGTKETWTITTRGRDALLVYPTPEQLRVAADEGRRAGKSAEAGLVASEPTTELMPSAAGSAVEGAVESATDERYDSAR